MLKVLIMLNVHRKCLCFSRHYYEVCCVCICDKVFFSLSDVLVMLSEVSVVYCSFLRCYLYLYAYVKKYIIKLSIKILLLYQINNNYNIYK